MRDLSLHWWTSYDRSHPAKKMPRFPHNNRLWDISAYSNLSYFFKTSKHERYGEKEKRKDSGLKRLKWFLFYYYFFLYKRWGLNATVTPSTPSYSSEPFSGHAENLTRHVGLIRCKVIVNDFRLQTSKKMYRGGWTFAFQTGLDGLKTCLHSAGTSVWSFISQIE